eukprot:CAMPEP_0177794652 /NCGR_PEP_ID=MMETSP0491_2-20121128/25767_1 /TAXON_ID=63592 /ORGANISM="Tetraselmis chuii, Strain PLY429" /LENGTH=341 /DNA_ID=CAMNT_0019317337 /DNA_START=292 /DNA_END=1318 /DNA_ORIENTATION=+
MPRQAGREQPGGPSSILPRLAATGVAAATAEALTFPIDIVKTRLQLQGEMQKRTSTTGAFRTAAQIIRQEGIGGLYAGVSPAVMRHIPYSGGMPLPLDSTVLATVTKMGMGLVAGATGQFIAVPADLVKVRMQADGRLVAAGQLAVPRYTGMLDAMRKITAQEGGVLALWRGATPAIQRAALANLGELATYDLAKQYIVGLGSLGDGSSLAVHGASSVCSGLMGAVMSTPADVVKTRMMNQVTLPPAQPSLPAPFCVFRLPFILLRTCTCEGIAHGVLGSQNPEAPLYRGSVDCLMKALRSEGVRGLYKGFIPTWARLGPWQIAFWVSYEQIRVATGLGSF